MTKYISWLNTLGLFSRHQQFLTSSHVCFTYYFLQYKSFNLFISEFKQESRIIISLFYASSVYFLMISTNYDPWIKYLRNGKSRMEKLRIKILGENTIPLSNSFLEIYLILESKNKNQEVPQIRHQPLPPPIHHTAVSLQ